MSVSWCRYCGITLLLASFSYVPVWAASAFTDGIVASVGGEPILQSDVMQEILPKMQGLSEEATSKEDLESKLEPLFKEALEQVIEHFILYKEAEKLKIEVSDADVENHMADVKKQYASQEEFQKALEEAGYTVGDFRERMRRQMMAITVGIGKRRQFETEAVVSETDLAEYYRDHEEEFRFPARYRVRRIFIQASQDEEARKAAMEKISGLRDQVLNGGDFAAIASEHSQGPEAKEGGLMGWVKPGDLVEPLDSALLKLGKGDTSEVLETEFGVQLLRVEEIEQAGVVSFEEARTEIEPVLRKIKGEERYRQWMSTLRQRSNVRVLI